VRIATWNVNSLTARLSRVEEWIRYARPDVLCLQETKQADAAFPHGAFTALGYQSAHHGDGRWNGVAIISRVGIDNVSTGLGSDDDDQGTRLIAADCGGARVLSVYVPNGRALDDPHYPAKLAWLSRLRALLAETSDPSRPVAVCGDFNVAPEDRDVWDPGQFDGMTQPARTGRTGRARVVGPGRRLPPALPGRQVVQLVGLPGRVVPPAPGDADRPHPGDRGAGRQHHLRPDRPAGPQRREAV
jgi:exodeoxyribonuclease-3